MRDYRFSQSRSGSGRDPQLTDRADVITSQEFDGVAELVKLNERHSNEVSFNELARELGIVGAKVQTILEKLGYQHDWHSYYRLVSDEAIGTRIAKARREFIPKEQEVQSAPNPYAGMTLVVASPASTEGKIEELGKKRATISVSTFSKEVNLEPEQLRQKLVELGWKQYLSPLQLKSGMKLEDSGDYQLPQTSNSSSVAEAARKPASKFEGLQSRVDEVKLACQLLNNLVSPSSIGAGRMIEVERANSALEGLPDGRKKDILSAANIQQGERYLTYRQDSHQRLAVGVETGDLEKVRKANIAIPTPPTVTRWSDAR